VPSESGLTNSGRLFDPDVIPEQLWPFINREPPIIIVRDGVLYLAENLEISFNRLNPEHSLDEFIRQVDLQEHALQQLNVSEWLDNVKRYDTEGRLDTQVPYRNDWIKARAEVLEAQGMTPEAAKTAAKAELDGQVGLHGPDQFPGGNPDQITGFGDSGINSSIGAQWSSNLAKDMEEFIKEFLAESGFPAEYLGDVRLNVTLKVNDVVNGAPKIPLSQGVTRHPPGSTVI
jgi:hypothetical protein